MKSEDHRARLKREPVQISKRLINSLAFPGKGEPREHVWDAQLKGFGLRLYSGGRAVYVLQYRLKGPGAKTQTHTIGDHGSPWTPDGARERARDLLEQVRRGVDPNAEARSESERDASAAAAEAEATRRSEHYGFDAFADRYIERHVRAEALRSLADIEGTFARDLRPAFAGRSVLDITREDVQRMRSAVGERSTSAANKAHKWLNAAFMWGIEHDGLTTSPMIGLKKPFKEGRRDRLLADWEVAIVWASVTALDHRFAMLERMMILTGQRLREVAGMRWEEIDLEGDDWIVPASRTKNKRPHLVPISPQLKRLLVAIEPDPDARERLVLTTNGRTPISGFSKAKQQLDAAIAERLLRPEWRRRGPLMPWVRHDHRRTTSTGCGQLKIPLEHAEAVLNHVSGSISGVAGTYWLYKFADEKRDALNRWGEKVEAILTAHKVPLLPPTA